MEFLNRSDEILSVGEFTRRLKMLVKTSVPEFWLRGEISNLKRYPSGHTYFTLKDENASISAVLFKGFARGVSFALADGMKILAYGEVNIYEPRGSYSFSVKAAIPDGAGGLAERFNILKDKLSKEGLFNAERKREIPLLPKNVAVITSPSGAAIRDFCKILARRNWRGNVCILPSKVQGVDAASEIASQVEFANKFTFQNGGKFDLIIAMRGGGSLEDLWLFNEEIVARAVANSGIPTISAVGHEVDFTLCDFSADLRAETPSAAAEILSENFDSLRDRLNRSFDDISDFALNFIGTKKAKLEACEALLRANSPQTRFETLKMRLDGDYSRLSARVCGLVLEKRRIAERAGATLKALNISRRTAVLREKLNALEKTLNLISMENTLARGFAVVVKDSKYISNASDIANGETFTIKMHDNSFDAKRADCKKSNLREL